MRSFKILGKMTLLCLICLGSVTQAAATSTEACSADQKILEQAAGAMDFQVLFADMALALSDNADIKALAQHIHDLSKHGRTHIESMAAECGFKLDANPGRTGWRRILAMREISSSDLRDQVYLDGQLMRLYEARDENHQAMTRSQHDIVQAFAQRSEPEIEALIAKVRAVAAELAATDAVAR